jgi:hypothetical protein
MKYLIFLLLSLCLIQCSAGNLSTLHQTYNQDDYLYWSDSRKLSWDDFKGVPQGSSDDYTTEIFVSIPSSIDKTIVSSPKLTSVCVFDKRKSWVNKNVANDTLLLYNQTIFDIHEVYARKLRKTFMETDFGLNDFKEKYMDMTAKNNNDLLNRIDDFRRESFYGHKSKAVLHWAAQIKNELKELNQFKMDY